MKKKWMLLLVLTLVLAGCGSKETNESGNTDATTTPVEQTGNTSSADEKQKTGNALKGYVFEYNGVQIAVDLEAAPVIAALGEADSYFEAPSCAFEGLDKTYGYGSFEINTYEQNGKDYISCIYFKDDMIETSEGVSLYETKTDMIAAYGENYAEEFGMLVYEKDGMKLKFILDGEEIISIEYATTVLDVQ